MQSALHRPLRLTRPATLWRMGYLPSVQGRRMHQSNRSLRDGRFFYARASRGGEGTSGRSRRCRPSV
ncbi:Cytochrome P450 (fragment) [Xanthomonas citri pv. bilvae]